MSKKKKIDGKWYDYAYWETSQRGGKGGYDSIPSLRGLSEEIADDFARVFGWDKNTTLLDAGCGPGFMVARWSQKINAYGIDASEYALKKGMEVNPVVKDCCYCEELTDLSRWENENFDVIHCNQVLEHIYEEDTEKVVAEFYRVLKPKGLMICAMPMSQPWEDEPRKDEREPSHVNVRRPEYWINLFSSAGFMLYLDPIIAYLRTSVVWPKVKWQMLSFYKPISISGE